MVSNINLKHDIGRHIAIYPVRDDTNYKDAFDLQRNIEGASFDLTASKYAWSIRTKATAVKGGAIIVEPKDTVIVFTNESISLDNTYAGACYNKLKFSARGILHASSPLKPGYTGRLSVSLYNSTEEPFAININSPIVVIMLHKLSKRANVTQGNGNGSRFDLLATASISISDEQRQAISAFDNAATIMSLMKGTDNYKKFKQSKYKYWQYLKWLLLAGVLIASIYFMQPIDMQDLYIAILGGLSVLVVEKALGK